MVYLMPSSSNRLASDLTKRTVSGASAVVWLCMISNGIPERNASSLTTEESLPPESDECATWVRQAGVSEADVPYAIDIIYRESGCRVDAANASGAYGIPQALPGSKMAAAGADWETNPVTQIRWMSGYVSRYGGWQEAINFWYAHGWY